MDHPELHDLVEAPRERLDVEYKAWLNLGDREAQARLAKHLCALANHGGGFVVFGIADDMTPAEQPPPEAGPYDQDRLSAIVRRYLTPVFQVAVYTVTASGTGTTTPSSGSHRTLRCRCAARVRDRKARERLSGSRRSPTTPGDRVPNRCPRPRRSTGGRSSGVAFSMTAGRCSPLLNPCCGPRAARFPNLARRFGAGTTQHTGSISRPPRAIRTENASSAPTTSSAIASRSGVTSNWPWRASSMNCAGNDRRCGAQWRRGIRVGAPAERRRARRFAS